ncbi:probable G-protein coupled receptor 141 [Stegastes partitus]|uniref:Probable G-protein coupled receptor 141 n=1 Tax=Stegastes partitus TaxID=144197 RepID=A0A9Y4MTQ0_9TELE|nr:PREDICTED: probable G-protein coupled receptor 141 [Stegastes partitus]
MTSTVAQSTLSTAINSTLSMTSVPQTSMSPSDPKDQDDYHTVLLVIYSVVLLCGTISLSLMVHVMKSSATSTTSIAVLNLIFAHFIFLLTVPFRMYYYATSQWSLSHGWCKMVSGMIHIHMYMSFVFYVIILITRLLTFYHKADRLAYFQRIHAFILSALVWIAVLVMVPCIIHFSYGKKNNNGNKTDDNKTDDTKRCFRFGDNIESAKAANYIISTLIIVVAVVLTALQANVLWVLYKKHRQGCTSQQDFGAQLKSLCFALVMVACFIPYHLFRLYYLEHIHLQNVNEVFLSFTTFNCLDMLTFLGRRTCNVCLLGRAI